MSLVLQNVTWYCWFNDRYEFQLSLEIDYFFFIIWFNLHGTFYLLAWETRFNCINIILIVYESYLKFILWFCWFNFCIRIDNLNAHFFVLILMIIQDYLNLFKHYYHETMIIFICKWWSFIVYKLLLINS